MRNFLKSGFLLSLLIGTGVLTYALQGCIYREKSFQIVRLVAEGLGAVESIPKSESEIVETRGSWHENYKDQRARHLCFAFRDPRSITTDSNISLLHDLARTESVQVSQPPRTRTPIMKAKACTSCRQSKLRCDSDTRAPDPCSRCQSMNKRCIFDRAFHSTSKSRRLQELEAEVTRLRQTAGAAPHDGSSLTSPMPTPTVEPQGQQLESPCLPDKSIGNVTLKAAQVDELFRVFFAQCHPYLPFSLPASPETIYERCVLLFWVICAVASCPDSSSGLQAHIQAMIGQIATTSPRSIEVVQALLIMCMWPFPFYSTLGDPSFLYCGLATRIGLQIGLHRPELSHEFSSRSQVLGVSGEVRRTTWMACYIVNQMQASRLGVPIDISVESTLSYAVDLSDPVDILPTLFRISRMTVQFTTTIGANARNSTGLLAPPTRIDLVRYFSRQLDSLEDNRFNDWSLAVKIAFLTSKLQLWSFVLQEDVPRSEEMVEFYYQAEHDATAMLQVVAEQNLARSPFHLARSVLYSALVLIKIIRSPFSSQPKTLHDQIQLASRCLSSAIRVEDDHAQRWSRHIQKLVTLQDLKRTLPIRSRMAASLVFDAIRVMKEHLDCNSSDQSPRIVGPVVSNVPELDIDPAAFDLDGVNWDALEDLF